MTTIKNYADLEQSKKLAKILLLESADMFWLVLGNKPRVHVLTEPFSNYSHWESYPCWSLSALLGVLPKQIGRHTKTLYWFDDAWHCEYVDEDSEGKHEVTADNPVDACYEMIVKLKEQKLL